MIIYKNPNGDSRTAPKNVTFKEFQKANDMHRQDVKNVMNEIAYCLMEKGSKHDWSKKEYENLFYDNFISTINEGTDFVSDKWYQFHIHNEKHHPLSYCHEDIDLLDILEMIIDCACAGKSRSGSVRSLEINNKILELALENTVKMIDDMLICEDK